MIYAPAPVRPEIEGEIVEESTVGIVPERSLLEKVYEGIDIDLSVLYDPIGSQQEFEQRFLPSKIWRLNNLYTIIDKSGDRRKFVMNFAQHYVYAAIMRWYRIIILKSRQQGISTFWLICFEDDVIFYPDINAGLMAQGKREASKLLKRAKLAWTSFDGDVKRFLGGLKLDVDSKEELGISTGSSIYIQVSFRGDTLHRLHVSELGKIANNNPERVKELKRGTLQTIKPGNPVIIESTADGDNDFRVMWELACSHKVLGPKDFAPVFLSWLDDPDCVSWVPEEETPEIAEYFLRLEETVGRKLRPEQRWFWVGAYRELDDDVYAEYPGYSEEAFMKVRDGTYYARLYNKFVVGLGREVDGLYDPGLSVSVAMDLGMDDTFVVVYYQKWKGEWRIIREYRNSGEDIEHYVREIFSHGYEIGCAEMPHDTRVRELQVKTRREYTFRQLGLTDLHVVERGSVEVGIEQVRQALKVMKVDVSCRYLRKCFKEYTKEWNSKYEVWRDTPKHDESSNGMDAVRVMVMGRGFDSYRVGVEGRGSQGRVREVIDGLAL